jgi:hypothetical protein
MRRQVAPHQILGVVALWEWIRYDIIPEYFILIWKATSHRMPEEPLGGSRWLTAISLIPMIIKAAVE